MVLGLKDREPGGMGRQVLVAGVAAAALIAAAYAAHRVIFAEAGPAPTPTALGSTPPASNDSNPQASVERPNHERAVVRTVTGPVEWKTRDGAWQPLRVGDEVHEEDTIRTAAAAQVTVDLGANVSVEISEKTEIRIVEVTRSLSHVRLSDGRLLSVARGREGSSFRVEVQGSEAVAEASDAKFAVMSRKQGHVAVATTRGNVQLSAQGEAVSVGAGQQALVTPGAPPSKPMAIAPELFLELGPPPPRRTAAERITITGRTNPGAVLHIRGQRQVVTDAQGEFSEVVALQEGDNDIVVSVQDVMGRSASEALPRITVDVRVRTAPTTEVTW